MGLFQIDGLADSGSNPITLKVSYGFTERDQARRVFNRSMGGVQRAWDWGTHKELTIPITHVTSGDAHRINQWWRDRADVLVTLDNSLDLSTMKGRLVNDQLPLGNFQQPYREQFQGALMITALDASSFTGQFFVLDDVVLGLLDQNYNVLG